MGELSESLESPWWEEEVEYAPCEGNSNLQAFAEHNESDACVQQPLPLITLDPPATPAAALRIQVWSWNTESVRFSESENTTRKSSGFQWDTGLPLPGLSSEAPIFVKRIAERVKRVAPHLIAFAFQEEAKPGSYLLSHAIPEALGGDYELLSKTRLMGVGLTTLHKWTVRGLRLGVFARRDWLQTLHTRPAVEVHGEVCDGMSRVLRNKGGAAIVIDLPHPYGRLDLVNMHLPFDSNSLSTWKERSTAVDHQMQALEHLHDTLVIGVGQPLPDHVILMGDLNFRIDPFCNERDAGIIGPQGEVDRVLGDLARRGPNAVYKERDELRTRLAQSTWLSRYREGVDGGGPTFWPTAKLQKDRKIDQEDLYAEEARDASEAGALAWLRATMQVQAQHGRKGPRTPGWTDRVLYRSYEGRHGPHASDPMRLQCTAYERWDLCALSDHAAVMSEFTLA